MNREFADLLKRKREAAGLSQSALAKAVDISPSHLNRIEKAQRNPPPADKVLQIAYALHLSPVETDRLLAAAGYAPRYGQLSSPALRPGISPEVRTLIQEVAAAILRVADAPDLAPAQREDIVRILRTLDLPGMIARVSAVVPGVSAEEASEGVPFPTQPDALDQDPEALWRDYQNETLERVQRRASAPPTLWAVWQSGKA